MHRAQAWEEVAEVTAEIGIQPAIGIDAEEFFDRFNGQDLAIGEGWRRAALAQLVAPSAHEVVDACKTPL